MDDFGDYPSSATTSKQCQALAELKKWEKKFGIRYEGGSSDKGSMTNVVLVHFHSEDAAGKKDGYLEVDVEGKITAATGYFKKLSNGQCIHVKVKKGVIKTLLDFNLFWNSIHSIPDESGFRMGQKVVCIRGGRFECGECGWKKTKAEKPWLAEGEVYTISSFPDWNHGKQAFIEGVGYCNLNRFAK
jgi:hypothetical protein